MQKLILISILLISSSLRAKNPSSEYGTAQTLNAQRKLSSSGMSINKNGFKNFKVLGVNSDLSLKIRFEAHSGDLFDQNIFPADLPKVSLTSKIKCEADYALNLLTFMQNIIHSSDVKIVFQKNSKSDTSKVIVTIDGHGLFKAVVSNVKNPCTS